VNERFPISLAVIIPVRNEEQNLARCLASLPQLEEVLVVDSHSSDRTGEIATAAGVTLLQFDWDGGPVKKRNWVLRHRNLGAEWILFLDADEQLTESFIEEMKRTLPSTRHNGFWLRYTNHFMGKELRFGEPMRKLALLRRGHGEFEILPQAMTSSLDMEVHEHLIVEGSVGSLRTPIIHHDYKGVDAWFRRHVEYASWEAERFDSPPMQRRTLRQRIKYATASSLLFPFAYFFYSYVLRGGFLDGLAGLRFAAAKWTYFVQVALKIAERRRTNQSRQDGR
jgi:glycosyltransferase involved in cell wall biosynthesis